MARKNEVRRLHRGLFVEVKPGSPEFSKNNLGLLHRSRRLARLYQTADGTLARARTRKYERSEPLKELWRAGVRKIRMTLGRGMEVTLSAKSDFVVTDPDLAFSELGSKGLRSITFSNLTDELVQRLIGVNGGSLEGLKVEILVGKARQAFPDGEIPEKIGEFGDPRISVDIKPIG